MRLLALGWLVLAIGMLDHVIGRRTDVPASSLRIALAVSPLALPLVGLASTFYNYTFEFAVTALLIWVWVRADEQTWAWWTTLALVVLIPLTSFGTLFGVPAVVTHLAYRSWRDGRIERLVSVVGAGVAGAAVFGAAYVSLYTPSADAGLFEFWSDWIIGGERTLYEVLGALATDLADGLLRWSIMGEILPSGSTVVTLLTLSMLIAGLFVMARVDARIVAFAVVGAIATLVAAILGVWPFGLVRVNLAAYGALVWLGPITALAFAVIWLAGKVRVPQGLAVVLVPAVLVPLLLPFRTPPPGALPFAMGIERDLAAMSERIGEDALVVGYHTMVEPYLHYFLETRSLPEHDVAVTVEPPSDHPLDGPLYRDLSGQVPSDIQEVWCVLPFELGQERTDQACELPAERWMPVMQERGERAFLLGYRRR